MGNFTRPKKTLSGARLFFAMFFLSIIASDLAAWQVGQRYGQRALSAKASEFWVVPKAERGPVGSSPMIRNPQQAKAVSDAVQTRTPSAVERTPSTVTRTPLAVERTRPAVERSPPAVGRNAAAVGQVTYLKAFIVDDRLSALRRSPDLQSEVIRRIRLGHTVFITRTIRADAVQPSFCRVAVTRRTRGWIHASALVIPGRAGEDQRIMNLIEAASDGVDRITLCRMLVDRMGKSPLVPRALLLMGQEAERAAETLSQRARRRLSDVGENNNAGLSDYYLNDASLDRYSKLHIVFGFNQALTQYVYDGRAYRDIIRRFPGLEEATLASQRLQSMSERMAREQ